MRAAAQAISRWLTAPLHRRDPLRRADAIVVPGARVLSDGSLSRSALERVATACALHSQGWAPWLVLSGGCPLGLHVEAEKMGLEAERRGISRERILLEPSSRDTWENAEFTTALLRLHRLSSAIVVTHAFHSRRVTRAFLRRGILARAFPVAVGPSWMATGETEALRLIVREYVALFVDFTGGRR